MTMLERALPFCTVVLLAADLASAQHSTRRRVHPELGFGLAAATASQAFRDRNAPGPTVVLGLTYPESPTVTFRLYAEVVGFLGGAVLDVGGPGTGLNFSDSYVGLLAGARFAMTQKPVRPYLLAAAGVAAANALSPTFATGFGVAGPVGKRTSFFAEAGYTHAPRAHWRSLPPWIYGLYSFRNEPAAFLTLRFGLSARMMGVPG